MTDVPSETGVEMSEAETRSLLESKAHGVLSMGAGDRGYGLPMSFGYDEENGRLVLGFANTSDSKKRRFATKTEEATLNVYEYEDVDSWASVLVTGSLHRIDGADVSEPIRPLFFRRETDTPDEGRLVDFDEYERVWYELRIDEISGRHSG